ncbi:MAG TPA: glycosyltransferase family 4 protein [Flavobacterium sp.]|nr:glycosyltransferase family 4 protein [Flavobacterium sp.]
MRILQLIDSLDAGGAERMAVNYANALAEKIEFSGLAATRKEGPLKKQLHENVFYIFLNKKGAVDLKALSQLKKFAKQHQVEVLHAHGTSFFMAVLLKLSMTRIKIIWHDHYGNSEFLEKRNSIILKMASFWFSGIISVNKKLQLWSAKKLYVKNIVYLPNFVCFKSNEIALTVLEGIERKKIICLANLRIQKNHLLLLDVAVLVKEKFPDWTFHLVGKDFKDSYSEMIKKEIENRKLAGSVFIYGSKEDIGSILNQAAIAVLTSSSEGLPVALLEYGFYKKPVVATNVGQISEIIENNVNGFLIRDNDASEFAGQIEVLIKDDALRNAFAANLNDKILKDYTETSVIEKYLRFLQ